MKTTRLCAVAALMLLSVCGSAAADTFQGTLSVIWGDPKNPGGSGDIRYVLETPDRQYLEVTTTQDANALLRLNGQRVLVNGQTAARPAPQGGGDGSAVIVADSIVADPAAPALRAPGNAGVVSGVRRVLFLMLKFKDDADAGRADPHPSTFFSNLTNPDTPSGSIPATINGFFKKTSNNTFSWLGDVAGVGGVGGTTWITLPKTKAEYANCGWNGSCFNFGLFNTDAIAAGNANGITWTNYSNINFVISNDLDCCAWGGTVSIGGASYGATWEPPWGQETRVYAHEMGHSIGLPHSGWVYFAYDSPWDVMSNYRDLVITTCGSYFSTNSGSSQPISCREPGNGYIMAHRDVLGWIPPANQLSVSGGSTTQTLEGGALAVGAALKMIKICLTGWSCTGTASNTRYFTVEARVKNLGSTSLYDNGIPAEGVVIHEVWFGRPAISGACFFNSQSGWAVPVDSSPGDFTGSPTCSGTGLDNSQFSAGQTYTNATYGFKVSVLSRSGSNFVVTVSMGNALAGDFDGDAKADMTIYKGDGTWQILKSSSSYSSSTTLSWGGAGYVPVAGDYDGDGRIDPAVYNTATGQWSALKSSGNYTTTFSQSWGGSGYLPEPGDYDGDGKTDLGLYQQSTGTWTILKSSTNYTSTLNVNWGGAGYTAIPGRDFDGDGKADIAVYAESTGFWYILKSSTNNTTTINVSWGGRGYTLVPGDYDGDGKADLGLYDRASGAWLVLKSSTNYTTTLNIGWGGAGYDPVPGDYDGDGKIDLAIVQRSTGNWYVLKSSTSYTSSLSVSGWGTGADTLVSGAIVVGGSTSDTVRATDFDADGRGDITVYNPTAAYWYTLTSGSSYASAANRSWGGTGYSPVPGDFDGDGKTDYGLYQTSTGVWSILLSGSGYTTTLSKGAGGGTYVPAAADYDGDGKTDIAVYDPSSGNWYVLKSSSGFTTTLSINWGGSGYTAVPGDYDGDGKADLGIYQASTGNWNVLLSSSGYTTTLNKNAGGSGYVPVQGDYDGDGKTDFVVYNSSTGLWYGLKSSSGYTTTVNVSWGGSGYVPVRLDADGDGRVDLAIYQTSSGNWYILLSGSSYSTTLNKSWGGAGYNPVPAYPN